MKEAKDKAKELIEKFGTEKAILCVDEIILSNPHSNPMDSGWLYSTKYFWQQVKKEI